MGSAKEIMLRPISRREADAVVKRHHYSGSVVNNSQVHIGVFLHGECHGAMQFGPPLDRRKVLGIVEGTRWDGCLELNRMAFGPCLPRNSESRALAVAMRLLRRHAPQVEWVVSFADAAQCGHGTIYQASGFVLTGVRVNNSIWASPAGVRSADLTLKTASRTSLEKGGNNHHTGAASMKAYKEAGWRPLPGFQLRYLYFLNPDARSRLTCPVLPFSEVDRLGARMYRGRRVEGDTRDMPGDQPGEGGATPTSTLDGEH